MANHPRRFADLRRGAGFGAIAWADRVSANSATAPSIRYNAPLSPKIGVDRRDAAVAWARERGFGGDSVAIRRS